MIGRIKNIFGNNLLKSTLFGGYIQAIKVVQNIIWIPLYISYLGTEMYGQWLIVLGFSSLASLSDVGIQVYWLNTLIKIQKTGDNDEYKSFYSSGYVVFGIVSAFYLVALIMFLLIFDLTEVFATSLILNTSHIFVILTLSFLLNVLNKMVRGIYRIIGQYYRELLYEIYYEIILLVLISLIMTINSSLLFVAYAYLFVSTLGLIYNLIMIRNSYPNYTIFSLRSVSITNVIEILRGGSFQVLSLVSNILTVQGSVYLVNLMYGGHFVTIFSTVRTFMNVGKQLLSVFYRSLVPVISHEHHELERHELKRLIMHSLKVVLLSSLVLVFFYSLLGPLIYHRWTDQIVPDIRLVLFLFSLAFIFDNVRMTYHEISLGFNMIKYVSILDILYALFVLVFLYLDYLDNPLLSWAGGVGVVSLFFQIPLYIKAIRKRYE